MNIKTKLLEQYINFVDLTKKQTKNYKAITILFRVNLCLFLFLFYLNII